MNINEKLNMEEKRKNTALKNVLVVMLIFFISQMIGSVIACVCPTISMLGVSMIIASLCSVGALAWLNKLDLKQEFSKGLIQSKWVLYVFVMIELCSIALNIMMEQINLTDMLEEKVTLLVENMWGLLAVCVVGPIAEELIFRGAICGMMLRRGSNPLLAICVSAVIFGLIHFNPAQIPFAICLGVILGLIYYKTRSVIPVCLLHIFNNSLSAFMMNSGGARTFTELLGHSVATYVMLMGIVISCCMAVYYWKKHSVRS